jgi:hypothetical protein
MREGFAAAYVALLCAFFSAQAWSQNINLGTFGVWNAYEARSVQGRRICGISTSGTTADMHIKHFEGEDVIAIQIFNRAWNIPHRVDVSLAIELGSNYRTGALRAVGVPRDNNLPANVETSFLLEGSSAFWTAFRQAASGRLIFLTGNEGAWSINLTGSNAATTAMQNCITRGVVNRRPFDAGTPTRPFDTGTPSRPFDTSVGAPKSPF